MAELIYVLCAATSVLCAVLLVRGYRASRSGLLLWSALCFVFLGVNNVLLLVDLVIVPAIDLAPFRTGTALIGMTVLVFGLTWEDR
jgi:hypothetical protein